MRQPINFSWRFKEGYDPSYLESTPKDASIIDLPHNVKALPYHDFDESTYQGLFTYFLEFDDKNPSLPIKMLHFDGIMLKATFYLNGKELGEFISGFFPIEIDVSDSIKKTGNRLVVVVDSSEDPLIPPFGHIVDYLTFGGIYRKAYLDSYPFSYIKDIYPLASKDGRLSLKVTYGGRPSKSDTVFELFDGEKKIAESLKPDFEVEGIIPWDIDNPKLYTLKATYGEHVYTRLLGFRDIEWKEEGFFINGKKTKLIGLNRHQSYPYIGMASSDSLNIEDARLLKDSGINVVRTSHYADDESFLNECDRLGLLLIDEIPGWQHIGKEKEWRDNCVDFARRLIIKERHHPCLIAYGLRIDESGDDNDLYSRIRAVHHELDPFRKSLGVRNFKDSELLEDIFAFNDFSEHDLLHGLDAPKTYPTAKGKPKLVTENNGHMYPTKPFDNVERRITHALRHARVADDAFGYDDLCGELSWCAFDYNTHVEFGSGDRICYHGVYDIFRNPKYAAFFYGTLKKEPFLEVCSTLDKGDEDESLLKPFVVFTNMDYVDLYKNDVFIGRFLPNKKDYPNLPHAPIWIDDFIGDTFDEPSFNNKEKAFLTKALNSFSATGGLSGLSLREKATGLRILAKHHLRMPDLQNLYNKYMGSVNRADFFSIRGYKDGKMMVEKTIGTSHRFHYEVKAPEELVNGDSYDAKRVSIIKRNEYGMQSFYSFDVCKVELSGPIALLGPDTFPLVGGSSAIFVRSLPVKKPTIAKIKISFPDDSLEREILVR